MKYERLINGKYYHIYNRGNNRRDLFLEPVHYEHFLALYDKYISPVAETFAWVLMPNHFHLVVRLKENVVYKYANPGLQQNTFVRDIYRPKVDSVDMAASGDSGNAEKNMADVSVGKRDKAWFEAHKWETVEMSECEISDNAEMKKPVLHRHFSHLFNAYTRYFNKITEGTGNLFERPFKRKQIRNEAYLKKVILYVHNNPVHHGFCTHLLEYPWSSYLTCISNKPTKFKREVVLSLFNERNNFENQHTQEIDVEEMEEWLDLNAVDYTTEIEVPGRTDLSACAASDNVNKKNKALNVSAGLNAVRSGDADRLKNSEVISGIQKKEPLETCVSSACLKADASDSDLSACATPDNVNKKNKSSHVSASINAVRSDDADRLKNSEVISGIQKKEPLETCVSSACLKADASDSDLSACATPDNVGKEETNAKLTNSDKVKAKKVMPDNLERK
ncbi:hypothetical protein SAMN05444274_103508 [Mariniphaga anaerophila]|uniref:Transposase IS200-like domain-containing protein n=2 Tax=Mariniphaga anaerophila TaxID=1484053 RepID=A0A1M4YXI4_9BACT|nr:hypothetical protein SAMN05444274_103508 [Mariniphaga anaerophila]